MAEAQALQASSGGHEILAADRSADGGEGPGERRCDARELGHRDQERQTDARVLEHIAVGGEDDAFAPVTRIGQAIMRTAAVHPLLTVLGVMVGEREMWGAVTERLAYGDALGIERVGHAAGRRLRALLVDIPALEMLERAGVHGDEWRMNDR